MTNRFDEQAGSWDQDPVKTARAAEVARQILEQVDLPSDAAVLDFGSGTGLLGFHFLPRVASVTFADTSPGMLREVSAKLDASGGSGGRTWRLDPDALALPQRYDAIVSLMTLHHVTDPWAALAALAEHLEPGGWLALCDLDTEDGTFHDDPDAQVHHGFDRGELEAAAEGLGLEQIRTATAWVMRPDGPGSPREYPLFLFTARRPGE